ncbi:MAG: hypothetical protein MI863_16940 [Desulfobacterales bacterium]|nr:hypothetical protein [Desulfobacterales bacterium]
MIFFAAVPALGQDSKTVSVSGIRIQVFPFPQSLADMHMRISFNGSSGAAGAPSRAKAPGPVSGLSPTGPQPPDDMNTRLRAYLFQYLDVTAPAASADTFSETLPEYRPDLQTGPGEEEQGVSVKIQADVTEKSGALLFVMKI